MRYQVWLRLSGRAAVLLSWWGYRRTFLTEGEQGGAPSISLLRPKARAIAPLHKS
jgi:hypothetical protein